MSTHHCDEKRRPDLGAAPFRLRLVGRHYLVSDVQRRTPGLAFALHRFDNDQLVGLHYCQSTLKPDVMFDPWPHGLPGPGSRYQAW